MAAEPSHRTDWNVPSWMLTIDPKLQTIALEGGFSRSDSVAVLSLEEFLADIDFQKEIARKFGLPALEEALETSRHLLAKN